MDTTKSSGSPPTAKQSRAKRTATIVVVLLLAVAGIAVTIEFYGRSQPAPHSTPNPCGQVYEGQSRPEFVTCKGFVLTETGAVCSLSAGSCTMTVINNGTSREVVTTGCDVVLPIMVNGTGANRTTTSMVVEGINGGPAQSGVQPVSTSGATCWFPTNKYMTDVTVDQGLNGCFTFAQAGNLTNTVELCWDFGQWSMTPSVNSPLDCRALLGNLGVSVISTNETLGEVSISNTNAYGVWVAKINGTSTVNPLGISVTGPYVGDWFAIPQNETVPARSVVSLNLPGTPKAGQQVFFTLSFLPTNETITYMQPCSMTLKGTYPTA